LTRVCLGKLRRDIVVVIPTEVQVKYRVVQGVCRLVESLELINQGDIEGILLQRVHRVKDSITKGYLKVFCKECEQEPFWKA
jgi:hypothetical protein